MISLHIVEGWTEEICDAMNKYHGGDFYSFDSFSRYFRIWHSDTGTMPVAYVKKGWGYLYEPEFRKRKAPKTLGKNGGVLWNLSIKEDREKCLELIRSEGLIYISPGRMENRNPFAFKDPKTKELKELVGYHGSEPTQSNNRHNVSCAHFK